jgi:hypothetical protein
LQGKVKTFCEGTQFRTIGKVWQLLPTPSCKLDATLYRDGSLHRWAKKGKHVNVQKSSVNLLIICGLVLSSCSHGMIGKRNPANNNSLTGIVDLSFGTEGTLTHKVRANWIFESRTSDRQILVWSDYAGTWGLLSAMGSSATQSSFRIVSLPLLPKTCPAT